MEEHGSLSIGPELVGHALAPVQHAWTERDAIVYALGIGARLPGDLDLLYEGARPEGLRPAPTFALTASTRMLPPLVEALALDLRALLHGAQAIELHRVPPAAGACTVVRTVTGVWDKGQAAIVDCEDAIADADGPLATARSSWWVPGAGGFGGPRSAPGAPPPTVAPDRPADARHTVGTSPEQAALYRLSGDLNPVHIDPVFAAASGQARPFLHGLCTFGILGRILDTAAGPDLRLASLSGRFTTPVFPGDDLEIELWQGGGGPTIARVSSNGHPVLGPAEARFTAAARARR